MTKTDSKVIYAAFGQKLPQYKKAVVEHMAECIVDLSRVKLPPFDPECLPEHAQYFGITLDPQIFGTVGDVEST